jgi:hypothetical protein
VLEDVLRGEWERVLATLVGFLGDIELAKDGHLVPSAERDPRLDSGAAAGRTFDAQAPM